MIHNQNFIVREILIFYSTKLYNETFPSVFIICNRYLCVTFKKKHGMRNGDVKDSSDVVNCIFFRSNDIHGQLENDDVSRYTCHARSECFNSNGPLYK